MPFKVKIQVVRSISTEDIFGENASDVNKQSEYLCPRLKEGEEFIVNEDGIMPHGFCSWAFADIHRDITHLRFGGDYPWAKESGTVYSCCTDGLRPVIMKLSRIV